MSLCRLRSPLRSPKNALFFLAVTASPALAQVDGKVTGTVIDLDTSQPLAGAQVIVEGTNLGNVSNVDGYYFINHVPVGIQRFSSHYLGYETITHEERILAGQTSPIDFALPSDILQAPGIVAIVEREPLIIRDNVVSKSRFTAEEARGLPVDDIGSVITLGAGVYEVQPRGFSGLTAFLAGDLRNVGSGYVVRGGRPTESATYVDGVLVTDFANQLNATETGNFAVEEADVVTGGFGAEFGHAQSGVVNIVTRSGGTEFHGNLRFTTDGRFGTDGYDIAEQDAFEHERCCGFNQLQASFGGPVIEEKLTFFGSLEAIGAADIDPHAAGFNPAMGIFNSEGSTETILPGNRGDRTRLQAKLTSFPTRSSRLTGTYLFARDQQENYNENRAFFQHLNERATRIKTYDVILGYDRNVFQTSERNLNIQVRGHFHQTLLHRATPRNPTSAEEIQKLTGIACGIECLVDRHSFAGDFLNYRFDDIEFFFEDSMPMLIPGLKRPSSDNPDPVFGIPGVWADSGFNARFNHRKERRYGIRLDLDSQLTRIHRAKVGLEWTWIDLANRSGFLDGGGGDVYDVDPQVGALYVQDRFDFGDLVVDLGLRWDRWDPNTRVPILPGVVNCEITPFRAVGGCREEDAPFQDAPTRSVLSPRLGVAHPVTDETQVRLSYGKFHQLPELRHFFQGYLSDSETLRGFFYGNPNLDYIQTTAFEVGLTHLLSRNLVLDVVGYNRDRRGAIRADLFPPQALDPRVGQVAIFTNADNGNVKGLDITLAKKFGSYWSTDLAWSLQWARGTTSSPTAFITSGFAFLFDPNNPRQFLPPPTELSAEDSDRLHTINWQFNLRFPSDFRSGTLTGAFFRDLTLYIVYNAHSGEPYSRIDRLNGGLLEDFNSSRLPWVHSGDLRVVRGFNLATGLDLDLFAVVKNFLDIKNVIDVNPTTGRPDRTGFEEKLSRKPFIPSEFKTPNAPESFPFPLEQILPEFREAFSRQDLDGDGVIALDEAQEALRRALIVSGQGSFPQQGDSPYNYSEPRQVRFGVELRF